MYSAKEARIIKNVVSPLPLVILFKKYLKLFLDLDISRAAPLAEILEQVGRSCPGLHGGGLSDCNYFPFNSIP